jgi:hypothetical protein
LPDDAPKQNPARNRKLPACDIPSKTALRRALPGRLSRLKALEKLIRATKSASQERVTI